MDGITMVNTGVSEFMAKEHYNVKMMNTYLLAISLMKMFKRRGGF